MTLYTEHLELRRVLYENLYLEVPEQWKEFVRNMVYEIYDVVRAEGLDIRQITFEQIKEKYGMLRVVYTTPYMNLFLDSKGYDINHPKDIFERHNKLCEKIDSIVDKYDCLFRNMTNFKSNRQNNIRRLGRFNIDNDINNKL